MAKQPEIALYAKRSTPEERAEAHSIMQSIHKASERGDHDAVVAGFASMDKTAHHKKDKALGEMIQSQFANHPNAEVRKTVSMHKRGILSAHEAHEEIVRSIHHAPAPAAKKVGSSAKKAAPAKRAAAPKK